MSKKIFTVKKIELYLSVGQLAYYGHFKPPYYVWNVYKIVILNQKKLIKTFLYLYIGTSIFTFNVPAFNKNARYNTQLIIIVIKCKEINYLCKCAF